MKARASMAIAMVSIISLPSTAVSQTNIGGLICSDTTWTLGGSPYTVTNSVIVGCNATLTIQPGVQVRFNSNLGLTVGSNAFGAGTVVARGTPEQRIHFRSSIAPQSPGAWARIRFTDFTIDADFDAGIGKFIRIKP
jgi:hypothetical protein